MSREVLHLKFQSEQLAASFRNRIECYQYGVKSEFSVSFADAQAKNINFFNINLAFSGYTCTSSDYLSSIVSILPKFRSRVLSQLPDIQVLRCLVLVSVGYHAKYIYEGGVSSIKNYLN